MKIKKLSLLIILTVAVAAAGLIAVFIIPGRSSENAGGVNADTDIDFNIPEKALMDENLTGEASTDETLISGALPGNGSAPESLIEFPGYYHYVSDVDETSVYLGGAGGIYRVDSEAGVRIIYSAPHIAGAALYGDYVFSLEYNVTDSGMAAELIRINKDGSGKEIMAQISSGSYDLRIIDNMLILSESIIGDYGLETAFQCYILDDEGNLASGSPKDAYSQFELPDGYGGDVHFLINPWFSTKYFDYVCFIRAEGDADINSVWIINGDEESAEEVITCSGAPLAAGNRIFYCNRDGEALVQKSPDNPQETVLYEIPDGNILQLLTYDAEWIYVLQKPGIDEGNETPSSVMRVNLRELRTEKILELQAGDNISNFNVYGNNCFFILSGADYVGRWECCNLIDFTITNIIK